MTKNYMHLWVSVMYKGIKDTDAQRIEGVVTNQKTINNQTLLTLNVANGEYRSIYIEKALKVCVESFDVETEQDEFALAVERFESMSEYTDFND